jgi:hypothetical protein
MIQKYHFNTAIQYSWGAIFSSDLDLSLIPLIRCEPDVEYLEFNQVVTIGGTATVGVPSGWLSAVPRVADTSFIVNARISGVIEAQ